MLLLLITQTSWCQDACYQDLLDQGIELFNDNDYRESIEKFISAGYCYDKPTSDILDSLIKKSSDKWVLALETSLKKQIELKDSMEAAKTRVDGLLRQSQIYQDTIKQQANNLKIEFEKSEQQRKRTESTLYTLQAQEAKRNNEMKEALVLAFAALEVKPDTIYPETYRTFTQFTGLTMGDTIYSHDKNISNFFESGRLHELLALGEGGEVLVIETIQKEHRRIDLSPRSVLAADYSVSGELAVATPDSLFLFSTSESQIRSKGKYSTGGSHLVQYNRQSGSLLWATYDGSLYYLEHGSSQYIRWKSKGERILQAVSLGASGPTFCRSSQGNLTIWDNMGRLLREFTTYRPYIKDLLFNPSQKIVAIVPTKGQIQILDSEGEATASIGREDSQWNTAIFTPSGEHLLVAESHQMTLFTLSGKEIIAFPKPKAPISHIICDPEEEHFIAVTQDNSTLLYRKQLNNISTTTLHEGEKLHSLEYHPSGDFLLGSATSGTIFLWDKIGSPLMEIHSGSQPAVSAFFARDGESFFVLHNNQNIVKYPLPDTAIALLRSGQIEGPDPEEIRTKYKGGKND